MENIGHMWTPTLKQHIHKLICISITNTWNLIIVIDTWGYRIMNILYIKNSRSMSFNCDWHGITMRERSTFPQLICSFKNRRTVWHQYEGTVLISDKKRMYADLWIFLFYFLEAEDFLEVNDKNHAIKKNKNIYNMILFFMRTFNVCYFCHHIYIVNMSILTPDTDSLPSLMPFKK